MMMLNQLCANINVVLQLNRERKQHTYMYFQWNLKFPTTNQLFRIFSKTVTHERPTY